MLNSNPLLVPLGKGDIKRNFNDSEDPQEEEVRRSHKD
jgi:hypothetical protein